MSFRSHWFTVEAERHESHSDSCGCAGWIPLALLIGSITLGCCGWYGTSFVCSTLGLVSLWPVSVLKRKAEHDRLISDLEDLESRCR